MAKKIYFLFATPPLQSYLNRYCIDYFDEKGWETHIVDLSYLVNPIAFKTITTGLIADSKREVFYSKREYERYVKAAGTNAIFVFTSDFYLDTFFIHRYIGANQKYGYLNRLDNNPEPEAADASARVNRLFSNFSVKRLMNSVFIRVPRKIWNIKPASFVVLGGMANESNYINLCYTDANTVIKHIHSLDYDRYLQVKDNSERMVKEPYCVFIDQFLPYHPDGIAAGMDYNAQRYYSELAECFSRIEKATGKKVVIAAHPRSDYGQHSDVLRNYTIFRFKTAELIKDADFVLAHFSTSISLAVAFNKPVVLLSGDDINQNTVPRKCVEKYAELLDLPIWNLSRQMDMDQIPIKINAGAYKAYMHEYMKPQTGEDICDKPFKTRLYELVSEL